MANKVNGHPVVGRQEFEAMILKVRPRLMAYAVSLTGSTTLAEDIVQETIVRALIARETFEPGTKFLAWLFTIASNWHKSGYRKFRREVEWNPEHEDALFFSTGFADSGGEAKLTLDHLLRLVACLPPNQSDTIIAVGYLGLSYDEAAECLGCAAGTIKSRLSRGREALAVLLEGGKVKELDLTFLKTATKNVPRDHPYYIIARAYEEVYAACDGVTNGSGKEESKISEEDEAWQRLVSSGALEDYDSHEFDE